MDDLKTILDRIKKPLTFAARDNFAHIKSLAAMEPFIHAQVQELKRVSEPIDGLSEIEKVFSGFDSLTPDEKKKRVLRATELIEAFERGPVHPVVSKTSTPPEALAQHDPLAAHAQTSTLRLDTPVQYCKGIGPKRAELLKKLGVSTIDDALSYLPWRYEDRGNLKKISRLAYGSYETVSGEVVSAEVVATKRQRVKVFELLITDKSGMIIGSWFNQPFMQKNFEAGMRDEAPRSLGW